MVFISLTKSLEDFLKEDIQTRVENQEWLLFDSCIKSKDLKKIGNYVKPTLNNYMSRIFYYPIYYKEPLYCYLITNREFYKLNFFSEEKKHISAIWNMKRVPMFDNQKEEYPRIKENEKPFVYDDYYDLKEYMKRMFNKLIDNNFKENPINFVVLGSEKSLKETSDNVYNSLNVNKNHPNENTHLLVEKALEEYISKGGKKDLKDFESTLDDYLMHGYCGY